MAHTPPPPHLDLPTQSNLRARSPHTPLLRTSSSASIAGDAAFAAAPPPLPPLDKRSMPFASAPAAPRPVRRTSFPRRRPRLVICVAAAALCLFLIAGYRATSATSLLYLLRFKLRDRAFSERWSSLLLAPFGLRSTPCTLRKEPLVFVRGDGQAALVWETNGCPDGLAWTARIGAQRPNGEPNGGHLRSARPVRVDWEWRPLYVERRQLVEETTTHGARIVHTAPLANLSGGELYQYELRLNGEHRASQVVRHAFPWLGFELDATRPTTLHIAFVADNQYNLRIFRRVLLRLISLAKRLPSRYFAPGSLPPALSSLNPVQRPHLLLHGGDAVQNPHDLAQWQTDFWDALTRGLSSRWHMGQKTPILLARGNHDWDATGVNAYTGGPWGGDRGRRGTYHAFSPHPRMRVLVLDSNLPTLSEQQGQEKWLDLELNRDAWRRATLRVVVVHTAPWIEWWDRRAWTDGGESQWSAYVRTSLMPLLARARCSLVLSGHSHAYTRGFLPYSLVPTFASAASAAQVASFAVATARERGWERTAEVRASGAVQEEGMVLVTCGGAGGTLDADRVEDWGFMRVSRAGSHHGGWLALSFAGRSGSEPASAVEVEAALADGRRGKGVNVYGVGPAADAGRACTVQNQVEGARDVLEWRAVGVDGAEVDRFFLVAPTCQ